MIFIKLFFEFLLIGFCAFGGGLATIPFLEELSQRTGWYSLDELANMIAVSESTPGAIGINMSTYVGYIASIEVYGNPLFGLIGGVCATLGLVTPSILVILVVCQFLNKFKNSKQVKWTFYGLRAASIGLIGSAAYSILTLSICSPSDAINGYNDITNAGGSWLEGCMEAFLSFFDLKCLILALVMGFFIFKFKKHPILYIAISAIIGIIFNF